MAERSLQSQWMLITSAFMDSAEGLRAVQRCGGGAAAREALALLRQGFADDLCCAPQGLDSEHLLQLLGTLLPARMTGAEPWRTALPDLLEELLLFTAQHEGLACAWEWSNAVTQHRSAYEQAFANPQRARAAPARYAPDVRPGSKLGRNDPCPCGSGKKYKKCCGGA